VADAPGDYSAAGDLRARYWWADQPVPVGPYRAAGLTFRHAWSVCCARCGARAGHSCRSPTGYGTRPHRQRLRLALACLAAGWTFSAPSRPYAH
jgi:hypothetical protein